MEKRLSFSLLILLAIACSKNQTTPSQPVVQTSYIPAGSNMNAPVLLMDSMWYPVSSGPIEIAFGSDGTYYEDEMNSASIQGIWKVRSPDSLIVTRAFWKDQYRIVKVSEDTLKIVNVVNFVATYIH